MLKRSLCLALLLALVLTSLGLNTAPAIAAPAHAVAGAPNADVLPADTAFYFDFKVGDLNKTVDYISETYKAVTDEDLPPIFAQINMGLSQALKRDATFEKDIQSWLGDHISLAFRVTDEQYDMLNQVVESGENADMSAMSDFKPQVLVVIAVKDDAAASTFMNEVIETAMASSTNPPPSQRTVDVNGQQVTVYDQTENCGESCPSFTMIKGYMVFGVTESVDELLNSVKANTPRLSADANFSKVMGKLKPDNLMSMYISPRLLSFGIMAFLGVRSSMSAMSSSFADLDATADPDATPEATPDPTAQIRQLISLMRAYNGQAIGLVQSDKAWTVDIVQSIDTKALAEAYTGLGLDAAMLQNLQGNQIEGKLAGQIPNDAVAVIMASGLGNMYEGLQVGLEANSKLFGSMNPQIKDLDAMPQLLEGGLMMAFGVDLAEELKGWANSEFAIYVRYNADSVLAEAGREPFPFDLTLIVDSTDAAKTKAFLEKINEGFGRMDEVKVESAGTDLYTITGKEGIAFSYGLVGNTFIVTTASGLEAASNATKGDGVLNALPQWKTAQQTAVQPYSQFWFINFNEVAEAIEAAAPASASDEEGFQHFMKLIGLFDTLAVSSGVMDADGISMTTVQLIQK